VHCMTSHPVVVRN